MTSLPSAPGSIAPGTGSWRLTREGGHHRDRVAHAGGDATGAEIERALEARLLSASGVDVIEHAVVLDLLRDADGAACGVTLHVMDEGQRDGVGAVHARAVVLATGGLGQVYTATTNPAVSTGDGVAAALRAGAVVRDLEFVQFHPTVVWLGRRSRGQQPLVSEAVRGEGAVLVDDGGVPVHGRPARAGGPRTAGRRGQRPCCGGCGRPAPSTSGSMVGRSASRSGGSGFRPSTRR